jgi:hypothetical protein
MCYTIFRATPGANVCVFSNWYALNTIVSALPILSRITNNLFSSGGKKFIAEGGFLIKLKINVRCPNTKALAINKHQF